LPAGHAIPTDAAVAPAAAAAVGGRTVETGAGRAPRGRAVASCNGRAGDHRMRRAGSAIARKIVGPFREFGWGAGALYALDRVLSGISPRLRLHVYEWMVQPISAKPLLRGNFKKQLAIREIRGTDPEIGLMPVRPEVMRERLR